MASRLNGRQDFLDDGVVDRNVGPRSAENLKGGPKRYSARRERGVTSTCSFTLTKELDLMIERLASEWNCSRSKVLRQILMMYQAQNG